MIDYVNLVDMILFTPLVAVQRDGSNTSDITVVVSCVPYKHIHPPSSDAMEFTTEKVVPCEIWVVLYKIIDNPPQLVWLYTIISILVDIINGKW